VGDVYVGEADNDNDCPAHKLVYEITGFIVEHNASVKNILVLVSKF
jgi:hypothetical protein